jgi:hypothetical protein
MQRCATRVEVKSWSSRFAMTTCCEMSFFTASALFGRRLALHPCISHSLGLSAACYAPANRA